jgi:hypothetical protein
MNSLPFTDARSAKDWLILLPLINTPVAHAELRHAMRALASSDLAVLESLKALEILRESVHDVQFALLTEYAAKPLPLNTHEQAQWLAACDLWGSMADAYARCWEAAVAKDSVVHEFLALLAQRTLRCLGFVIRGFYTVGQKVPDTIWEKTFACYCLAEKQNICEQKVKDSLLYVGETTTVQAVFIHALLLSAANPGQYTLKRLLWIDLRLELLALRSSIALAAPAAPGKTALQIDLNHPAPPQRIGVPLHGTSVREIDTLALAQVLSKRIKLLRQGKMPEELGLGKDFSPQVTTDILLDLYRFWCDHSTERAPREATARTVPVILGLHAQHRYVMDSLYQTPPQEAGFGSRDLLDIHLFGDVASTRQAASVQALPPIESWEVINETAQGLRVSRKAQQGERISLNQLMVVKSSSRYLAGAVRWLEESDGQLHVGMVLLPGLPKSAAIRPSETTRSDATYTDVVLLPAMLALKAPISLLLPIGWFRMGRQCELWNGTSMVKIKLLTLLERGSDFERVYFTELIL